MIFDDLKGYTPLPLRIARDSIEARHRRRHADEIKEIRQMEPLLGPVAADAIAVNEVDPTKLGQLLEAEWRRATR